MPNDHSADGFDVNIDDINEDDMVGVSYDYFGQNYDHQQKSLEKDHVYK